MRATRSSGMLSHCLALRALVWMLLAIAAAAPHCVLAQAAQATVRMDGQALFRVGESGDQHASARARQIERRLLAALEAAQGRPPAAQVIPAPNDASGRLITVGGRTVVSLHAADAQERGISTEQLAQQWAGTITSALQRAAERRASPGARLLATVRAGVENAFGRLAESAAQVLPRALAAVLVIGLFWAFAAAVRKLLRVVFRAFIADRTVENLLKQVAYYTVWLIGLIVAANASGLEPNTLATSLGLTGLALGFALKDILSNFVSGLLILTLRPFELGDQIVVGETEGSVERIELRATIVRTYDGRLVSVPNAETFTSRVTNNTASPVRRASVELHLGYDVDLRQVTRELLAAAFDTAGVLREPEPTVRMRSLDSDGIAIELRFWTDSRRSDYLSTTSEVRFSAVDRLKAAGVPFPEQTIRMEVPRIRPATGEP